MEREEVEAERRFKRLFEDLAKTDEEVMEMDAGGSGGGAAALPAGVKELPLG